VKTLQKRSENFRPVASIWGSEGTRWRWVINEVKLEEIDGRMGTYSTKSFFRHEQQTDMYASSARTAIKLLHLYPPTKTGWRSQRDNSLSKSGFCELVHLVVRCGERDLPVLRSEKMLGFISVDTWTIRITYTCLHTIPLYSAKCHRMTLMGTAGSLPGSKTVGVWSWPLIPHLVKRWRMRE
jgi:hypothetical protein